MKAFKYSSLLTLIAYSILMFIDPVIVAWTALVVVFLNTVSLFLTEYYVKKELESIEKRKLAHTLATIAKVKKL